MLRVRNACGHCLLACAFAVSACGEESREFTASELVDELNENGAALQLEGSLPNEQENIEVYELSLSPADSPTPDEHAENGITVIIADDEELAEAEFERCESSVSLTCYRVANGVLLLGGDEPSTLAKLEAAVRAMDSD